MKFSPPIIKSFNRAPSVKSFMILITMIIGSLSPLSAQTVSVDVSNTPAQLVDMLMNGSCAVRSNQHISSPQSVGYFYNNNSNFPINEGIIIRNGNVLLSQGAYTGQGLSSELSNSGDLDLQEISNNSGQISTITDVGFLEFDFVPNGNHFNFNFLFASNEYGEWQCGFSDVFAFLLTDLSTGETINLAVVPGTETPISVKDIRDSNYNSSCNSVNKNLFSTYNVDNPASSVLNMRGYTVVMNASAQVTPGNVYRIKLAIGDYNDSDFDSAVFIEAGSFSSFVTLGEDQTLCGNDTITLDTGISDMINYSFTWSKDGVPIVGQNNPTITVSGTGVYDVFVTTNNGCNLTDQVVISDLQIGTPTDINVCDNGVNTIFDLTVNSEVSLGVDIDQYEAYFYSSLANANNNIVIPTDELSNYQSSGNQTIYIRFRDRDSNVFCPTMIDFDLTITSFNAGVPTDFDICENIATIDIPNTVENQILNGLDPAEFTVSYYNNLIDATNAENEIQSPSSFSVPSINSTLWARMTNNTLGCFEVVDFDIGINTLPNIDILSDVTLCDSFALPALTQGNYFSGPGGTGTPFNSGDVISGSIRVYIYNTNANGCSIESSFKITILQSFEIQTNYCSEFVIPQAPFGNFYTAPNGPNGSGVILNTGTILTTNQRVYYYAGIAGIFCVDKPFDIVIHTPPPVDTHPDITSCTNYTLPPLTHGNYFTGQNGTGLALFPGDELDSSFSYIHIYNNDGMCSSETRFLTVIIDPSDFQDVSACGNYTLPQIATSIGGYFTEPGGNGTQLAEGTILNASQEVYYYVETTDPANCTTNLSFNVTINPIPPVSDDLIDVVRCIDNPYLLPQVEFGRYFTEPNGQGTLLHAGDTISNTQTVYIYNSNGFCSSEHSFEVEIRPLPPIDNFTDIFVCEPYVLPALSVGAYYTQPNAQGTELNAGDVISTTQTIYIYGEYSDLTTCASENVFTVNVLGIIVDQLQDVNVCDNYTLPTLTVGDYYTEPFGQGARLEPGDLINTTQTLYIYAENGNRFICFDNHEFTITVSSTPLAQNFQNQESCGSYTLPTINLSDLMVVFYREPGGINLIAPADYTLTEPGIYTIHARSQDPNNANCYIDEVFSVTVQPLQELIIEDAIICVDANSGLTLQSAIIESGLDPIIYTVNWYLNTILVGTGANYEATETGIYTVETTKLIPDVGNDCNYATTQVEVRASSPQAKVTFLTEPFSPQTNIRVDFIDTGLGNYEYRLNNGPFQTSTIFLNIPFGDHIITIRDMSSLCGDIQLPFTTMSHPTFFTPNGDGINDTWNIPDLSNITDATIKIFDRYGKFIKEIRPSGEGWNGLSKSGNELPSSSYWFKVDFMLEGVRKTYASYFALKRR